MEHLRVVAMQQYMHFKGISSPQEHRPQSHANSQKDNSHIQHVASYHRGKTPEGGVYHKKIDHHEGSERVDMKEFGDHAAENPELDDHVEKIHQDDHHRPKIAKTDISVDFFQKLRQREGLLFPEAFEKKGHETEPQKPTENRSRKGHISLLIDPHGEPHHGGAAHPGGAEGGHTGKKGKFPIPQIKELPILLPVEGLPCENDEPQGVETKGPKLYQHKGHRITPSFGEAMSQ